MPKLTDIRDKFKVAVQQHANLRTFHSGLVSDINRLTGKEYPLLVLAPPESHNIDTYKTNTNGEYEITFWVIMEQRLNDDTDDIWQKLEWMIDYGEDVIDTVINKDVRPAYYDVSSRVVITPIYRGSIPGTVEVRFSFNLVVKDCRNLS